MQVSLRSLCSTLAVYQVKQCRSCNNRILDYVMRQRTSCKHKGLEERRSSRVTNYQVTGERSVCTCVLMVDVPFPAYVATVNYRLLVPSRENDPN